jgi:hypothetical protein
MDIGSVDERRATEREVRDLRVLLYSYESLFVRQSVMSQTFVETWRDEMSRSEEPRLAFLRALYRIKPRLCVLPANWCPPRLDEIDGEAEVTGVKVPRNQVYWSRVRNRKE